MLGHSHLASSIDFAIYAIIVYLIIYTLSNKNSMHTEKNTIVQAAEAATDSTTIC